ESSPAVLFQNRLKHWLPVAVRSALDLQRGQPDAVWLTHEHHVLHLTGGTTDVLFCRFPIVGKFDFICETQEGGAIGTDGGLVYGGLHFQAVGRKDLLQVWDPDKNHLVTRPSPFARHESQPVFNRVSIRSTKDTAQFESNFHPVWFDDSESHASPWLGLHSSGTKRPVFRNLRLTGSPIIPRQVPLTSGDHLRGWQSGFFGETQPSFAPNSGAGGENAAFDWRLMSGELIGAKHDQDEAAKPGLLRYQRPLAAGDSVTYQFLDAGKETVVHPTVGRLAFLLESTGVRVRWITTGDLEWTGLKADNTALEPLNRRGPRPLPLKEGQWNTVRIELSDRKVLVTLNDQLVYQRGLDPGAETQFGLYRPTRGAAVRVRQAVMRGDWPETLPQDFLDDPVALVATGKPPRDNLAAEAGPGRDRVTGNVPAIRRQAAKLPAEQRFEFLRQ
ncbi:MAG: DUF1583 domain-containing protein, partial [Pirellulales bacterium]|nr:DUF1583 domain-containing protein [Pirellulales bacterium]